MELEFFRNILIILAEVAGVTIGGILLTNWIVRMARRGK